MFRNTRSLSGTFSTIVNFTVSDFLHRSQKLSILNKIKHQQENNQNENNLIFPVHHKYRNNNNLTLQERLEDIYDLDIDKIGFNSYKMAVDLIKPLNVIPILKEYHILELDSLSKYTFSQLNAKSKMIDSSIISTTCSKSSLHSELDTDDEEYDEDDYLNNNDEFISNIYEDSQSLNDSFDDDDEEEENMNSIKTDFDGIKILDHIKMEQKDRYFKIKINDKVKYMHKQTACWILTNDNEKLSSDRLSRVIQTNKK
ncbi:unnamed protein product [Rotaria sordida]|uniref:Uncharacterized protein n=1 Tax=Rotaria sordida TaxID=392033 RepID=A0A816CC58_9BILA|nr:unnamed protein product [Rotaria sordida]